MSCMSELTQAEGVDLLQVADRSIDWTVAEGTEMSVVTADFAPALIRQAASFVTLRRADGSLRGCMGSSTAVRPLVCDVAANAHAAATRDPRFDVLRPEERAGLQVSVSVLSPLERMTVADTQDLVQQLRPGIDGLLLIDQGRRGTLLPAVWEVLSDPARFVVEVKAKAGWSADYWSENLSAFRYTAQSFGPS